MGKHGNAEIRKVPDVLKPTYKFHFLVMDGDSYRFEQDKALPVAGGGIWRRTEGRRRIFRRIFNKLWDACDPARS